jgi:hypothetical protein
VASENIREIQDAVVRGLEDLGMPEPRRHVTVQAQYIMDALVIRTRWDTLARNTKISRLIPTSESRYEHALFVQRHRLLEWAHDVVPLDALVLVRSEYDRYRFAWPEGWPRVPASVIPARA